ncbi:MAG: putative amino-acid permease [Solirubrobacterales bacterium]|nr:putative amino-acid permease [Solirubrobacterales bacterium]
MTPTTAPASDADELAAFGYPQQLHRSLGSFASFAAGFSFVSILTTVFQLFFFGFSFGGAAFFWTWPIVFVGQMTVALCFAELASRYPLSGCIYQWSRRLTNPSFGWFAGWTMIVAQIVTVAAAAIALQVVLPSIWDGFQLVGSDTSTLSSDGAKNAVILGALLVCVTTAINAAGIKLMSRINVIGVCCELVGVVALIVLLFTHAHRGPGAVVHQTGAAPGGSYTGAFIVSALMAAYVMVGFDSAGELSEETKDPRRLAPQAILKALTVSGIGGGLLLLAGLLAAPSLTDGNLATGGLPYVLTESLGSTVGKILLADVAVAVCVCTLAIQTAAMRMIFSMARDNVLPFSAQLSKVNERTGSPILPGLIVGFLVILLLAVNVEDGSVFLALTSVCITMLYGAYLMVTGPLLMRRLRGEYRAALPGEFSLGRFGVPVNVIAIVYGAAMMVNIGWPRASVYDVEGGHWYLQWFAPLFVVASLTLGGAVFLGRRTSAAKLVSSGDPVAVSA